MHPRVSVCLHVCVSLYLCFCVFPLIVARQLPENAVLRQLTHTVSVVSQAQYPVKNNARVFLSRTSRCLCSDLQV
jgi:hypothetical protein